MDKLSVFTTTLHCLSVLCLFVFYALSSRYFTHMFQLNSYSYDTHTAWMKKNKLSLVPIGIVALSYFVLAFFTNGASAYCFGIASVISLVFSLCFLPRKAKKPLVYTARVKRLLITHFAILILLALLAVILGGTGEFILFTAVTAAMPLVLLLANKVNSPVEEAVRNYYIKDAKSKLADCPSLKIIGITGSFGKTSVKYYLTHLLSVKYNVLMTPESYNTPMGVVKTVREKLRATHEIFVCEMGAKYVGDIAELCDIVHPNDGVITSIGEQHLETFGSIQNIINTKYELAKATYGGKLFVNIQNQTIRDYPSPYPAITYGLTPDADYYAEVEEISTLGTKFTLCHGGERTSFSTRLIGEATLVNIVGAIAVACEYGISPSELCGAVRTLKCVPHRMELIDRGDITIIDDAFNSNPQGAAAALDTLSRFDAVKIIITPGMVELGTMEKELNEALGENAASVCDLVIAVGQKQAKPILTGAKRAENPLCTVKSAKTFAEAMSIANSYDAKGRKKIVLLENDLPDNY